MTQMNTDGAILNKRWPWLIWETTERFPPPTHGIPGGQCSVIASRSRSGERVPVCVLSAPERRGETTERFPPPSHSIPGGQCSVIASRSRSGERVPPRGPSLPRL